MENTTLTLSSLLAKTAKKTGDNKPKKVYLLQVSPEIGQEIRAMFNIPASVSDAGCAVYILNFAKAGRDAGYEYVEPIA